MDILYVLSSEPFVELPEDFTYQKLTNTFMFQTLMYVK